MDGVLFISTAQKVGFDMRSSGCKLIYIDIGSNRGDTIEALLDSSKGVSLLVRLGGGRNDGRRNLRYLKRLLFRLTPLSTYLA
jgi:hypothetical protein